MLPRNFSISLLLGYAVSAITAFAAVVVLTGILLPPGLPMQLRITFGVILALLAIYRFAITFTQKRQRILDNEDE
jgi:hypothetical protein